MGAIKMVVDPDENTQTDTYSHNSTQNPDIVFQCVQFEILNSQDASQVFI